MKHKQRWLTLALTVLGLPLLAGCQDTQHRWWLPPNHSTHGGQIDSLFVWIFWITTITFIAVQLTLVVFLIKYRHRDSKKKAVFTHGNQRLEMFWTITPAIILAVLALGSKHVWDNFRYSNYENDPKKQTVLVIGQQFKWNTIYAGPDGQLGAYMVYPKPTDRFWSNPELYERAKSNLKLAAEGKPADNSPLKPYLFAGVTGPGYLPYNQARDAIAKYIDQVNPLGKVFEDPAGFDDDWTAQAGREMVIAKDRPVEVQLTSKDVIHDFYLPRFRVKLDAVPGMRGKIHFQSTVTSRELEEKPENMKTYTFEEFETALAAPGGNELLIRVNQNSPGEEKYKNKDGSGWRYIDPAKPTRSRTIIRDAGIPPAEPEQRKDLYAKLTAIGVDKIQAFKPGVFEIVCEELCGQGHGTMRGQLRVVSQEEFDARADWELYDKPTTRTLPATTQPAAPTVTASK